MSDLIVHGARGSMPVSGTGFGRYGGHTTCLAAEVAPGRYLVVDAGTGLRNLEAALPAGGGLEFTVLLTHYHWDHIEGLVGFGPLDDRHNRFTFYGRRRGDRDVGEVLGAALRPPFHASRLREKHAGTMFVDLDGPVNVGGVRVRPIDLRHPDGVVGLRIDGPQRSVVIATDHQAGDDEADRALAELAHRADVLIHDAQRLEDEDGDGHSSWAQAAEMANRCGAGRLVLTSHDPSRTDDHVDDLVRLARARFPLATGAFEGLRLPL
jgi:phosphoribosyl 1,2-cyclic phosphodiesterase